MVSYLYHWNDGPKKSFGHISLSLSNGTYISFWPENEKNGVCKAVIGGESRWLKSAEEEMRQNGMPIEIIPILDLDVDKITVWWEEFKGSSPKWRLLGNNCLKIVYEALCQGNSWFDGGLIGTTTPKLLAELVAKRNEGSKKNYTICSSCCIKPFGCSRSTEYAVDMSENTELMTPK